MRTRAMTLGLMLLVAQAHAATLAEVNTVLGNVELQYLILDVQSVGLRARLSNQQFELDRLITAIQANGNIPLDTQITMVQVVVSIMVKHQDIEAVLVAGSDYKTNVACHMEQGKFLRDQVEYGAALDELAEARVQALLASERYAEADRLLGITQVYIAELRARIVAF